MHSTLDGAVKLFQSTFKPSFCTKWLQFCGIIDGGEKPFLLNRYLFQFKVSLKFTMRIQCDDVDARA